MEFLDLEKALGTVKGNKLFTILRMVGLTYKDRGVIFNLFRKWIALTIVEDKERET